MSEQVTVFRMHNPTGMSNHVMSLENAVITQYVTKRPTIVYNSSGFDPHVWDRTHLSPLIQKDMSKPTIGPRIYELMNVPNRDLLTFIDLELPGDSTWHEREVKAGSFQQYFFNMSDDTFGEEAFSEGRRKFVLSDFDHAPVIHFGGVNLGYYSYGLMNRTLEVDALLSQIRWKDEYVQLAARIAEYIGEFNGVHVRTTDHSHNYAIDVKKFMYGLTLLEDNSKPLVICTDDPPNVPMVSTKGTVFVNDIINNEFAADFRQLPFQDNVTYGLISMLVMTHASDFVGTPGSTYTGLIHRAMWRKGKQNVYKTWQEEVSTPGDGPFTWNSWQSKTHPVCKMWWREWPECILQTDL